MENEVKEPALKYNYTSAEEYLRFDRASKRDKHELHEGFLVTMTGASLKHNRIVVNLLGSIHPFLKGKSCEVFPSDLRTKATPETFTYPDITIVCGKPELMDEHKDTLLNPSVIIEVLSPSTESYDRGNKFFYYMQIASLKEYIMIGSTEVYIQIGRKQQDNSWLFEEIKDIDSSLRIKTIDQTIALKHIYDNVEF